MTYPGTEYLGECVCGNPIIRNPHTGRPWCSIFGHHGIEPTTIPATVNRRPLPSPEWTSTPPSRS